MDSGEYAKRQETLFSKVLVALYKGILYRENDEEIWSALLLHRSRVFDHFSPLGITAAIDEADGYAYLRYPASEDEDADDGIPRLIARRQLTLEVSLLLALFRKKMIEFDAAGDGDRLVMTRDEIVEMMRPFLPDGSNEVKIVDGVEKNVRKLEDMGFLRALKRQERAYEVCRIIKAFINAEWLSSLSEHIDRYRECLCGGEES